MKKRNLVVRLLLAALTLTLCISLAAPALATGPATDPSETTGGSGDTSDTGGTGGTGGTDIGLGVQTASIIKNFKMDTNLTTPAATFSFTATKVSLDGSDDALDKMPPITIPSITYSASDTGTTTEGSNLKNVRKETGNFIPDISAFKQVGIYDYIITENTGDVNGVTYSQAKYSMRITVVNDENGGLKYGSIFSRLQDDKANPTDEKFDITKDWFVNEYRKDSTLTISKEITGALADMTKEFTFTMQLNSFAALEEAGTTYTGTITRAGAASTDPVTPAEPETPAEGEKSADSAGSTESSEPETFTLSTTAGTFTLGHGDKITFDLPVGTICKISENTDGYKPTVTVKSNGKEATSDKKEQNILVSEKENSVLYVNNKETSVPTGIVVDNLPFILLILVALGGLVGYVVLKRRKYKN